MSADVDDVEGDRIYWITLRVDQKLINDVDAVHSRNEKKVVAETGRAKLDLTLHGVLLWRSLSHITPISVIDLSPNY